jgi:hypothetical protein
MHQVIDQTMQRTKQYWYVDGLNEMSFGGICLVLAVYFFASTFLPAGSVIAEFLNMFFVLILVGSGLLANRVVNSLKARLTYPRTGFVAYRQATRSHRLVLAGVALLTSSLLASMLAASPRSLAWMPTITGLLMGAVWLLMGFRIGLVRFYLLALSSILIGSGVSIAGLENILGLAMYYSLMGLAMFLSGGLTLRSYLRHTHPIEIAK